LNTIDINLFQFLILLGSVQAVVFSLVIFFSKKYNSRANIFLGLLVLFTAISTIQYMLIDMNYLLPDNIFRKICIPFQWLAIPMFYIHVYEFTTNSKIPRKTSMLLAAPFLLVSLIQIFNVVNRVPDVTIDLLPDYNEPGLLLYTNLFSFAFIGAIVFLSYRQISSLEKKSKDLSAFKKRKIRVYKLIIKLALVIALIGLVAILLISLTDLDKTYLLYPFFVLVSSIIYWIGYVGVNRITTVSSVSNKVQGVGSNGLSTFLKVHHGIQKKQLYLNSNITLQSVAKEFEISPGYLSQLINTHNKKNFSDYINTMRIEAAKEMLLDDKFHQYTIESFGLECGFKSKSNFYATFRRYTGNTPKQYRLTKNES